MMGRWLDPDLPPIFYLLLLGRFFNMVGNSLVFPFLAVFLASRLHGSIALVGVVLSLYGLTQVLSVLVGGILVDGWGKKRVMLVSLGVGSVAAFLVGSLGPLPLVLAALFVMGFSLPLFQPASMAIVADWVPQERLSNAYALTRVASNAGIIIGPMLGSFLADHGYFWLFALDSMTLILFFGLVAWRIPESPRRFPQSARQVIGGTFAVRHDRAFLGFALLWLATWAVYAQLYQVMPAYMHLDLHLPPGNFGYLAAENGALVVLLQLPITRLAGRLTRSHAMAFGVGCYALGFFIAWLFSHGIGLYLAVVAITMGEDAINPTASAWVVERAPESQRGRYLGFFSLSSRLGGSVGPLLGGLLLSAGPSPWLLVTTGAAVLVALGYSRHPMAARESVPEASAS